VNGLGFKDDAVGCPAIGHLRRDVFCTIHTSKIRTATAIKATAAHNTSYLVGERYVNNVMYGCDVAAYLILKVRAVFQHRYALREELFFWGFVSF
jgi:hypothetical protein